MTLPKLILLIVAVVLAVVAVLVIIVAVVLFLMGVVLVQPIGSADRALRARLELPIGLLEGALDNYRLDMESFPATAQGLHALLAPPSDPVAAQRWSGPYTDESLLLDSLDQPYQYQYPGKRNPQKYDLWSLGPDGQDGTDDDIGNWPAGM